MEYRNNTASPVPEDALDDFSKTFKLPQITPQQIIMVEQETRKQSKSKLWYKQRAGRITASKLKDITRTNPENPSKPLIKSICYPESYRFSNAATRYLLPALLH